MLAAAAAVYATLSLSVAGLTSASAANVVVDVDATDISRRIVHAKVSLPAKTGPMTFTYPKWIPGDHSPDGTLAGVVNMRVSAGKETVAWTRDAVEMFAFHVDVPPKATSIEIGFDFVTPSDGGTLSGSNMGTENVGVVNFNQLVFVPDGAKSDDVTVKARLTVPKGWGAGTALPGTRKGDVFDFDAATLTTFVDSPVNMGRHFKRFVLDDKHAVSVAAESEAALDVPADVVTEWRQLVAEAGALFGGARHYRRYEFLVTLSDHVDYFGLEHHESSDNRFSERGLVDDDKRLLYASLLPHEYAHSWNGKFRRPAGIATGDYITPMQDDLLWVYEGLTEYLGVVLAGRSGLTSPEELAEEVAFHAADLDLAGAGGSGRAWRPLVDTAVAAQVLYYAPGQWEYARRSVDFYDEGVMLWLAVDTKIREVTKGAKSIDDFCKAFHGNNAGGAASIGKPEVKPYSYSDVIDALNAVAPYEWRGFWHDHIAMPTTHAPYEGLVASGWKIGWTDEPSGFAKAREGERKVDDERFSIGLILNAEDQTVIDVVPGMAAYNAGIGPGMKVVGVDGRKFSKEVLDDALKSSASPESVKAKRGIELLVENGDFYRTVKLDYHGGKRYPKLVRVDDKAAAGADVWSQITAPKTPHAARTAKEKKP